MEIVLVSVAGKIGSRIALEAKNLDWMFFAAAAEIGPGTIETNRHSRVLMGKHFLSNYISPSRDFTRAIQQ